jgi:plastocyanin
MMMTRMSFVYSALVGALGGAAVIMTTLFASVPAWTADVAVSIDNFTFSPQSLTVKSGTTVIWENADDIPHTVASTTKLFKSKALDTGDKFSFTFTAPGMYQYFCSLHPHMVGTIVVEGAAAPANPQ